MSILSCFTSLTRRKKKDKKETDNKTIQVRLQDHGKSKAKEESKSTYKVKVISHGSPVEAQIHKEEDEVAYEGEDEHEKENKLMKKVHSFSNSDLGQIPNQEHDQSENPNQIIHHSSNSDVEIDNDGHLSDPGTRKTPFLASPKLKRSCSNLETRSMVQKSRIFAPSKCESFEDLQKLGEVGSSPVSLMSHCSADRVILRKRSSSQILPSKSRRLWWKLFLWSHRNLHEPLMAKNGILNKISVINQQGGYSSDTLEPNRMQKSNSNSKSESPNSYTGRSLEKVNNGDQRWNVFNGGSSGLWPQNQWMAFSADSPLPSPLSRVDEWVQEISTDPVFAIDDEQGQIEITFPPSPDNGKLARNLNTNLPEEIAHANSVIQSLNSSSSVAYISGIGLKVIPIISSFSSLRSVNLSGNSIVHITPGSLPKGLHSLDLSRNKINSIEGLRDLTRLRVLDLSYNRISRIGQGLSKCTLVKELYLAGNKISNVEGLHRLLKLIILDLSFNKITTSKALGQLVANYNTLQALNLLGNPIQSNISDDQMRKTLCGLLPKLAYLNKQPVNPQKAREVATEAIAKAALGKSSLNARKRSAKRVGSSGGAGSSSSFSKHRSSSRGAKARSHHRSAKSSAMAS